MTIQDLIRIAPIPRNTVETANWSMWRELEPSWGITFPSDYKEFISSYGTVCIADFIYVFNPISKNRNVNLVEMRDQVLNGFRYLRDKYGASEVPFPLYPEPGGLLPCGTTDNGNTLFWLTDGSPENWPLIVSAPRDARYEKFDMTLTEFMTKILSRRISCMVFPETFPPEWPSRRAIPPVRWTRATPSPGHTKSWANSMRRSVIWPGACNSGWRPHQTISTCWYSGQS